MTAEFAAAFEVLKSVLAKYAPQLRVKTDTEMEYLLLGSVPSPMPQHKGQPMYFAQVRAGKAYVAFHLMPLYMNEGLTASISPELKRRMQGKTCFNFKTAPGAELVAELERLTEAGFRSYREKEWI